MSDEQNQPEESGALPGIVTLLGDFGPATVITEKAMAALFGRHPASIKRAVVRGELPPPVRMFGQLSWTTGVLVDHIEHRLEQAAAEAEQMRQKIRQLNP